MINHGFLKRAESPTLDVSTSYVHRPPSQSSLHVGIFVFCRLQLSRRALRNPVHVHVRHRDHLRRVHHHVHRLPCRRRVRLHRVRL
jgi:hypothetical protein